MKRNYNLRKMKRVPHPLLEKNNKLIDWLNNISDAEFEQKIQQLRPAERAFALKHRNNLQAHTPNIQANQTTVVLPQ